MVIVLGGGPAGLLVSYYLSRLNVETTLVEKKEIIGSESHCGGLVSSDFWEKLRLPSNQRVVLNQIDGLDLSIGSKKVHFRSRRPIAMVISRELFEKYLFHLATRAGAKTILGKKAKSIRITGDSVRVLLDDGETIEDDCAIIAEGLSRLLSYQIGIGISAKAIPSTQALVEGTDFDRRISRVFIDRSKGMTSYSYFIPIDEKKGRFGVISRCFDSSEYCKRMAEVLGFKQIMQYKKWGVWFHGPAKNLGTKNILLVGDAGGFVKPLTGGGIVWGGISARIAAETIRKWRDSGSRTSIYSGYNAIARKIFWRESRMEKMARSIIANFAILGKLNHLDEILLPREVNLDSIDYDFPLSNISIAISTLAKAAVGQSSIK